MSYYYSRDKNGYHLYVGSEIRYIGKEIAIGFTIHPNYKKAILHKHGDIVTVEGWFDRAVAKIMKAGALSLTEDVKMLVFSDIDPEEINKMAHRQEYLGEWLEKNNMLV